MRWPRAAFALGALLCVAAGASAQDRVPPADSARTDTLRTTPDTLSSTERLLEVDAQRRVQLAPMPLAGVDGLLPATSRIVFTRDSIDWAAARTLGDLLDRVPGVFLWRGGWLGRVEQPNYLGRGAASVEYTLDGIPYLPLGPDSLTVDAALPALSLLERVEVERSPVGLVVHLFTRRHDRQAPRTRIGVSSGDRALARYLAAFERRYPSGIGLSVGAEYFGVNAPQGGSGAANVTNGWVQFGWIPSPRFGVQVQGVITAADRDSLFGGGDDTTRTPLSPAIRGARTDLQVRGMWRARDDGIGPSADAFIGRARWSSTDDPVVSPGDGAAIPDSIITPPSQDIGIFGAVLAWRQPSWSATLRAFHQTEWTPLDARLSLGWSPHAWVTGSVDHVVQQHEGDRSSGWTTARLGVVVPLLQVAVTGTVSSGHRVASPMIANDPEQRFTDMQVTAAFERSRLGLEASWIRTDGWQPRAFSEFLRVPTLAAVDDVEWAVARVRLAALRWLTLESRYEHPVRLGSPDGAPPHHALTSATVRSKFLRNFPSGIFDLKAQVLVESWSPGVVGRDADGEPIPMPGRTFVRGILQLQIGPFIAYYDRVNFQARRAGNIPGYPFPTVASSFGVRWEFAN
ncbi:MAG: TonB-dependent receptor plug domain-containing protein [Gemmatimonadales bacterium]|nr:TonB-dependent receptor plug domain-containing protein [Gemmatimonadales bacterium]